MFEDSFRRIKAKLTKGKYETQFEDVFLLFFRDQIMLMRGLFNKQFEENNNEVGTQDSLTGNELDLVTQC